MTRLIVCIALLISLCGCTEEEFSQGGHDMLSGVCSKSANCSVSCKEGQEADSLGHCIPFGN